MTTPTTIPPAPADPVARTLAYDDPAQVSAAFTAWKERDAAQTAEIARLNALVVPPPPPVRWVNWWCADGMRSGVRVKHHLDEYGSGSPEVAAYKSLIAATSGPRYSWDTSNLGNDANLTDAQRISGHKSLFGTSKIEHVRVFFGTSVPSWSHPRIAALGVNDSFTLSSLSTDWSGIAAFLAATPAKFQRPGAMTYAFGHEREADLDTGPLLQAWLDGNARLADTLDAGPYTSRDDLVKITLWYSQEQDSRVGISIPNRQQMYGGQDFGIFGEDVYNPRASTRYFSASEMFGPITSFAKSIGRPCAIPEWGGERLDTDTTGSGRAKFIQEGAAFLNALT